MANPQREDGYTDIANEIMEALAKIRIPGEAMQVLFFILRKTYGWHKKEDSISLSQFVLGTGLKKVAVCKAIKKLTSINIIITKKGNTGISKYKFNKHYNTWKPLPKKVTITQKGNGVTQKGNGVTQKGNGVTQKGNKSLPKKLHTIKTITKPTITKPTITKPTSIIVETTIKVIELFNEMFQKKIKYNTEGNKRHIRARLKEGFSLDDFKTVFNNKLNDDYFQKNPQYYRIETLCGNKFESYLNEESGDKRQQNKEELERWANEE